MNKVQGGAILIGVAIVMNIVGRLFALAAHDSRNLTVAGILAVWMFVSIVIGIFGLFHLIVGLIKRS
ncbi:MAG TPA: hypothetical protein VFB38_25085 [Chthonomonadaceae bacterium]|nr:hypothetical protein [Chthonomonadaceae bacterium]